MEGQVAGDSSHHQRHRIRIKRKLTLWERTRKALEMPRLKRRDRNQRLAIVGVVAFLLVYLLVLRPLIDYVFPAKYKSSTPVTMPTKANKGLQPRNR